MHGDPLAEPRLTTRRSSLHFREQRDFRSLEKGRAPFRPESGRSPAGAPPRCGGFTLVEMLTVVAIMMILAALILTGLNVARERAKVLRARRDVAQLVTAWNAYYSDYHRFPASASITGNSSSNNWILTGRDVVQILRGRENHNGENPRRIPYMDFHQSTTQFQDPWNNLYRIVWDATPYDGLISVPGAAQPQRLSLAVWSAGKDGADGTKHDVRSWRPE